MKVEVQKKTEEGYICKTSFGMPAIITELHTGGECQLPSFAMQIASVARRMASAAAESQVISSVHWDPGRMGAIIF